MSKTRLWKPLLEQWKKIKTLEDITQFESDIYNAWKRRQINDTEFMHLERLVNNTKKQLFNWR